jgi:hypothetical protein
MPAQKREAEKEVEEGAERGKKANLHLWHDVALLNCQMYPLVFPEWPIVSTLSDDVCQLYPLCVS